MLAEFNVEWPGVDEWVERARDPLSLSAAYVEGRQMIEAYVQLFRRHIRGAENSYLVMTAPLMGIDYRTGDASNLDFAPDFVISSLVAHHMIDAELVGFLRWMEATAVRGWLINDLHRHWLAWAGFGLFAGVMRWHPIVRHDGALSVRRAFVRADWDRLLAAAGLNQPPVEVRWHAPFRWGVGRVK